MAWEMIAKQPEYRQLFLRCVRGYQPYFQHRHKIHAAEKRGHSTMQRYMDTYLLLAIVQAEDGYWPGPQQACPIVGSDIHGDTTMVPIVLHAFLVDQESSIETKTAGHLCVSMTWRIDEVACAVM